MFYNQLINLEPQWKDFLNQKRKNIHHNISSCVKSYTCNNLTKPFHKNTRNNSTRTLNLSNKHPKHYMTVCLYTVFKNIIGDCFT